MGKKILIVDDEEQIVILLKSRLKANNFDVVTAKDGIEGLNKVKEEKPDLLLLDVLMPGLTGNQVVQEIKALDDNIRRVPIIVMSAKGSMGNFFDEGDIHCFIPKPFDPKVLLSQINLALKQSQPASVKTSEVKSQGGESIATDAKCVILTGVEEYILKKIEEYLEGNGYVVDRGYDEDEAVELSLKKKPRLIISQYWEEPEKFDATRIYNDLRENPETQSIPFAVFCSESIALDAMKTIDRESVMTYKESKDLLPKIEEFIKGKA